MDLTKRAIFLLALFWAALAAAPAGAQELEISLFVNYGSAFRDGSWVPVDVIVDNNQRDIDGWLEIRAISIGGNLQSPVHRVPLDSPKGSRKRYRVHCYLWETMKIEALIYDKRRPLLDQPVYANVTPITTHDFLTLVLDDNVTDHGFLSGVVLDKTDKRRFYRENLKNETLSFLADYPQCFRSFNVIVMGDIDPNRVGPRHRKLFRHYVESGGVLVVTTGSGYSRYKDTWVEELLGVDIEGEELVRGDELAESVFSGPLSKGGRKQRQGMLAVLKPADPDVLAVGRDKTIATRRRLGHGHAVAFAVDASSHLLQDCEGYRALWRDIYGSRLEWSDFDRAGAGKFCSAQLPELSGVKIQPRSSVFTYLGLYFVVAVVANWLFWNRLKRREMAWLCLVIFSIGFTAYAMVFGTAGRAKSTELNQFQVLHIPGNGGISNLYSYIGVLSARTSRLDATLNKDRALVNDISGTGWDASTWNNPTGIYGGDLLREPFDMIVSSPPRIEDFRVRASAMRVVEVEADIEMPGGVTGELVLDESGLHGQLKNDSGIGIADPCLVYKGHIYTIEQEGGFFRVDLSEKDLGSGHNDDYYKGPGNAREIADFKRRMVFSLLTGTAVPRTLLAGADVSKETINAARGPYIFGWASKPFPEEGGGILSDSLLGLRRGGEVRINELLVFFDARVKKEAEIAEPWRDLPVRVLNARRAGYNSSCGEWSLPTRPANDAWIEQACQLSGNKTVGEVEIYLGKEFQGPDAEDLVVEVFWHPEGDMEMNLMDTASGYMWEREKREHDGKLNLNRKVVFYKSYRIGDWSELLDPQSDVAKLFLRWDVSDDAKNKRASYQGTFIVTARARPIGSAAARGDWPSWQ